MKNTQTLVKTLAATLITAGSLAGNADAATITSPVSITATGVGVTGYTIANTIDQSGLSTGFTSGVTDFDTYLATAPTHNGTVGETTFYATGTPPVITVDADLGSILAVDSLVIWNYPFLASAGIDSVEIFSSTDSAFTTTTSLGTFNLADDVDAAQVLDIADANTQYVRLEINTVHGVDGVGFSEIAFSATTEVIPEPSSALLLGFGALGFALRRRRA